jgi:hypothetical protein
MGWPRILRCVSVALVGALALAASASGAKPEIMTIEVDVTNAGAIRCQGFRLDVSIEGEIKVRSVVEDGVLVRELSSFRLTRTATNPATGESVFTPEVGVDFFRVAQDGSATLMIVGLVTRITLPGQGLVFADVGALKLFFDSPRDTEPEIVLEAGKHQQDSAEIAALLCAELAP